MRLVAEGDVCVVDGHQAWVADGDAEDVAAQVAEHLCRSAESRLGMDDPVVAVERPQEGGELFL